MTDNSDDRMRRDLPWEGIFLGTTVAGLASGCIAYLVGDHPAGTVAWSLATLLGAGVAAWWMVSSLRHGRLGVDVIALLALCGALAVHEELAGAVISVMLATGRTLEAWATGRARRELRSLIARVVRLADRYALWFLLVTLATAIAAWVVSGDFARTVPVLVVATLCPLILAAPVAFVSVLSRAATRSTMCPCMSSPPPL